MATPGRFLPPFFKNLLPEGFRARALRERRRIAPDDTFGMLRAVGADTTGDVSAATRDAPEEDPSVARAPLGDLSAEELLEMDLAAATAPSPSRRRGSSPLEEERPPSPSAASTAFNKPTLAKDGYRRTTRARRRYRSATE